MSEEERRLMADLLRKAKELNQERDALSTALAETTERMVALEAALEKETICPTCDGSGLMGDSCPQCDAMGYRSSHCGACNGTGRWEDTCAECAGTGKSFRSEKPFSPAAILAARDARMKAEGAAEALEEAAETIGIDPMRKQLMLMKAAAKRKEAQK